MIHIQTQISMEPLFMFKKSMETILFKMFSIVYLEQNRMLMISPNTITNKLYAFMNQCSYCPGQCYKRRAGNYAKSKIIVKQKSRLLPIFQPIST